MLKIYSEVEPEKLLHIIWRLRDATSMENHRVDIVPEDNFIQCSFLNMEKDKTFPAHKHIWKPGKESVIAQESWVIVRGSVKCFFYDIDNTLLDTPILKAGDASFTLQGGHTYEILEDNTLVYEYKTGPYEGQKLDKVFLDD